MERLKGNKKIILRYFICLIGITIAACKKAAHSPALLPDIASNLVLNIPLDGSAYETISNTKGVINKAEPTLDRHNVINKAMLFNRTDSAYIDFGNIANASLLSNEFTIACWIYVRDTTKAVAILSKRNLLGPFEYSIDNHFDIHNFNFDNWIANGSTTVYGIDPLDADAPIYLQSWHHITYVANKINLKIYVDGQLKTGIDARIGNNTFPATTAHFVIGNGGAYNQNHYFNGAIDDIKIYNKALDEATIKYLSGL